MKSSYQTSILSHTHAVVNLNMFCAHLVSAIPVLVRFSSGIYVELWGSWPTVMAVVAVGFDSLISKRAGLHQ